MRICSKQKIDKFKNILKICAESDNGMFIFEYPLPVYLDIRELERDIKRTEYFFLNSDVTSPTKVMTS